jgi:hypothetical protein
MWDRSGTQASAGEEREMLSTARRDSHVLSEDWRPPRRSKSRTVSMANTLPERDPAS